MTAGLPRWLNTSPGQLVLGIVFTRIVLRVGAFCASCMQMQAWQKGSPRFLACDGLLDAVSGVSESGDGSATQWLPSSVSHPTLKIPFVGDGVQLKRLGMVETASAPLRVLSRVSAPG